MAIDDDEQITSKDGKDGNIFRGDHTFLPLHGW